MAIFSLPGDVGTYVRTIPFDQRRKQYNQYGMNNVLGDFTGSVQQNQSLYNKVQKAQVQPPVAPAPITPAPGASATSAAYDPRPAAELTPEELSQRSGIPVSGFSAAGIVPGEGQKTLSTIEQQAKHIDDQSGGAASYQDILDSVDTNPDVILARNKASTNKQQNSDSLQLALQKLGIQSDEDTQIATDKAATAKQNLLDALEQRGLALGGKRDSGEAAIAAGKDAAVAGVQRALSQSEQEAYAKVLAQNEDIDIELARTIVTATNNEIKARKTQADSEQKAMDAFLAKQGLVRNPATGEVIKTAAQDRAEAAQVRSAAAAGRAEEGNKLTLNEAKTLNLPLSLVGISESQVAQQINSPTPASWFKQMAEQKAGQSLTPAALANLWTTFQVNFKKASTSSSSTSSSSSSATGREI